jgi:DNA topoisomerase-2
MADDDPYALSIEEKYPEFTMQEHVDTKDMWGGAHTPSENDCMVVVAGGDNAIPRLEVKTLVFPPIYMKTFDEAIVNAIDIATQCCKLKPASRVTKIMTTFDPTDGTFTIYNDGPGVEIAMHPKAKMWVPQVIFGELYRGSNLKNNASNQLKAGTNGVGIKIANLLSEYFIVETVYKHQHDHKYYLQKWTERMKVVGTPTIVNFKTAEGKTSKLDKEPHTKLVFRLDYNAKYGIQKVKPKELPALYRDLAAALEGRMYMCAGYVGWATNGVCSTYHNGRMIPATCGRNLADMIIGRGDYSSVTSGSISTLSTPRSVTDIDETPNKLISAHTIPLTIDGYPWEVTIMFVANKQKNIPIYICNVDGVMVGGSDSANRVVEYLVDCIKANVKKVVKVTRMATSLITDQLLLVLNCKIPKSHIAWDSQCKNIHKLPKIKTTIIDALAGSTVIQLMNNCIADSIARDLHASSGAKKRKIHMMLKGMHASLAGTARSLECGLMLCEGDSAGGLAESGITIKFGGKYLLGPANYGYTTTGGVIVNSNKNSSKKQLGDMEIIQTSKKFDNNKFIQDFLRIMGLDIKHKYDPDSGTYASEVSKLCYGHITSLVDQDHDGVGFIHSLIIVLIHTFWPKLLENHPKSKTPGFLRRLFTPSRRAFPKAGGNVLEFYTERDFQTWINSGVDPAKYTVEYVKGLGTNAQEQKVQIFKNFHRNLITYYSDPDTNELCEIYFGKEPNKRKIELQIPYQPPTKEVDDELVMEHKQSISNHMRYEAKVHKLSNLKQKLPNAVDGLNDSGRKVLYTSMLKSGKYTGEIKVSQLTGAVMELTDYQHGDACLSDVIIGKAFIDIGGMQLPPFVPRGNVGSRLKQVKLKPLKQQDGTIKYKPMTRDDAASPRYVKVKLNTPLINALYPREDLAVIRYEKTEKYDEPVNFVPIVPLAIMENMHLPADGWKIKSWARDIRSVVKAVRYMITHDCTDVVVALDPFTYNGKFKGEIRHMGSEEYCFGAYVYDEKENMLYITELPIGDWINPYAARMRSKPFTDDTLIPRNYSSIVNAKGEPLVQTEMDVRIKIKPGVNLLTDPRVESAATAWYDGIEHWYELKTRMDHHLNMMSNGNTHVIEFAEYRDVVSYWFKYRRDAYIERCERNFILMEIEIERQHNILIYINNRVDLENKSQEVADELIKRLGLPMMDTGALESHDKRGMIIATKDLRSVIINGKNATYDYLLNVTDKQRLTDGIARRQKQQAKNIEDLANYRKKCSEGKFLGSVIWLEELDRLMKVYDEGIKSDWLYGEKNKFTYT